MEVQLIGMRWEWSDSWCRWFTSGTIADGVLWLWAGWGPEL